jgi:hypothetical protein
MTTGKTMLRGHAPTVKIGPAEAKNIIGNPERFKYEAAWKNDDYRRYSPGEQCMPLFMETCKPQRNTKFIDWGAGTGRAGHIAWKNGLDVTMIDFIDYSLDEHVRDDLCDSLKFIKHDITKPIDARAMWGYCADVLEHVPEDDVDKVIGNILRNCTECFFQIATVEDHFGDELEMGPLHVTVRPYAWWLNKFAELECVVLHSNEFQNHVLFHVSAHKNFWWTRGGINTDLEKIHENIRANAVWDVKQAQPHEAQDTEIVLLCGGPSLNDFEDEIIEKYHAGMKICTVNGTYNWAQERGIEKVNQFMLDAREFNKRFCEPTRDDCYYFIASQCDPAVFEMLPKDRTFMWHVSLEDDDVEVTKEVYGEMYKDWFPVPGGCSVTLRAICCLQMLGFRKVHVYGFDSCLRDKDHHAFPQKENDGTHIVDVCVGRGTKYEKEFQCQDWMAVQAKEFMKLSNHYLGEMDMIIYGDGLISYITETGAQI